MASAKSFSVIFVTTLALLTAQGAKAENSRAIDLLTGQGFSVGNVIYLQMSYQAAFGSASTNPADLAVGHHDPDRHGITQQDIEFSLGIRFSEKLAAFAIYAAKVDLDDRFQGEFEEYYLRFLAPSEIALKGGRFYPRVGYHQEAHPHDFEFVDHYLANGRIFGEDNLALYGGQVSLPVLRHLPPGWEDRLDVAYGAVPSHEEHEHDHHHEEEAHEGGIEGESATFTDWAFTANYNLSYNATSKTRFEGGASFAMGANDFGRHTQIYGAHWETLWRPEGVVNVPHHHDTSQFLRWRTEAFVRHASAVSEGGKNTDFTDVGFYTFLAYGFPSGGLQAHLRAEYVSGVSEAELPERWRISPALTWSPSERLPLRLKLQYNFDHFPGEGNEHSIWAQFTYTWGNRDGHIH